MTPALIMETLRNRGARLLLIEGDQIAVNPRSALDDPLRAEIRRAKSALVAILREQAALSDPTPVPPPCLTCSSLLYWRRLGERTLHCQSCEPCPAAGDAAWYAASTADDPLAELMDPDARAALLWWYRQGHPEIADEEQSALHRRESLGAPDVAATLARLVDRVRDLRYAYWRARTVRET